MTVCLENRMSMVEMLLMYIDVFTVLVCAYMVIRVISMYIWKYLWNDIRGHAVDIWLMKSTKRITTIN